MSVSRIESLRIRAKLLQKAKRRAGLPFALKDAFAIIARSSGFHSWRDMKATVDMHECLRPRGSSALCSVWYGSYAEGRAHLFAHGGFLLPYQKQFFVCDANYLSNLGLHLDDPDLKAVGDDWVTPADQEAWSRLLRKLLPRGDGA
ncbi:MAG TPA: hypothetical protein VGV09_18650 [Steroidobacteraceae bacterium]|nr:hypothetical protein [Steroidobacteraceae bacterium]